MVNGINPSYLMGDFVGIYERMMRPGLVSHNYDFMGPLMYLISRGNDLNAPSRILQCRRGSWAKFQAVLIPIRAIRVSLDHQPVNERLMEELELRASRRINELDILMGTDEEYQRAKRGE